MSANAAVSNCIVLTSTSVSPEEISEEAAIASDN